MQGPICSYLKTNTNIDPKNKNNQQDKIPVINLIDPPRQLLDGNWRFNSVYVQRLEPLPPIMQFTDQLYLLGCLNPMVQFPKASSLKLIYQKNMKLKINPFESRNYFKTSNSPFHPKIKQTKSFNYRSCFNQQSKQKNQEQKYLLFDSNFQSGNLLKAEVEMFENRYHLIMQNDINTYGCTQWFFFKVRNQNQCTKNTFFINNFYKDKSLYQKGMKILIFSKRKSAHQGTGWVRGGSDISYYPNKTYENGNGNMVKKFFTLKFSYNFEHEDDEVYFAYNYPYTYSKLNSYLSEKLLNCKDKLIMHRTLCRTIADNKISLLTITNSSIPKSSKKSIFISSRVHPGQTVSSLIMQGIIDFLSSDDPIADKLRQKFIFKLIPMLNSDGVIHGNYRTNLAGIDLNRIWQQPDRLLSPEIYQLKNYIIQFNKQCPVLMICDLHGHSSKKSAFVYGCEEQKPKVRRKRFLSESQQPKLFPFMVSKLNEDFSYKFCNFSVQKSKRGTARVELWKILKIPNIFTLEASFCSAEHSEYHFRPQDYKNIGISFCNTIFQYFEQPQRKSQMMAQLKKFEQQNTSPTKISQDLQSDSQSQNDLFDEKLRQKLSETNGMFRIPKRKYLFNQENIPLKQQKKKGIRRFLTENSKKKCKTQINQPFAQQSFLQKKTDLVFQEFPLKKITIQTQNLKSSKVYKFDYQFQRRSYNERMSRSMLQKIEHSYRGKSSLYRIKRKGQLGSVEPYKKTSVYRLDYNQ